MARVLLATADEALATLAAELLASVGHSVHRLDGGVAVEADVLVVDAETETQAGDQLPRLPRVLIARRSSQGPAAAWLLPAEPLGFLAAVRRLASAVPGALPSLASAPPIASDDLDEPTGSDDGDLFAKHQRRARRWEIVARVANAVAQVHDYETLLIALRAALKDDLHFNRVRLLELADDVLVVRADHSNCTSLTPIGTTVALPAELLAHFAAGHRVCVRNAAPASDGSFDSSASVGLYTGGRLRGLFEAHRYGIGGGRVRRGSQAKSGFVAADVALLEAVAPHIAHGIANITADVRQAELGTLKERMSMLLVHDLKNPLSVIKGNLDMLREADDLDAAERAEMIEDARGATDRVLGMIVDLLDIARAEEGQLTVRPREASIEAVVAGALKRYRAIAASRRVRLEGVVAPGLVASLDVALFERIIENIVGNALRFAPAGGRVSVTAAPTTDGRILLSLENDGPPIPEKIGRRLFEKYGQIDAGEPDARRGNRGLGLYFCRLVVEAHGGTIQLARRAEGVCFEIRIPREGGT